MSKETEPQTDEIEESGNTSQPDGTSSEVAAEAPPVKIAETSETVASPDAPLSKEKTDARFQALLALDRAKQEVARSQELTAEIGWIADSIEAAKTASGEGGRSAEEILAETMKRDFKGRELLPKMTDEEESQYLMTLATEIMDIDKSLIDSLKTKIATGYAEAENKPTSEQVDRFIDSVRTGLYGGLISGRMSAQTIKSLVSNIEFMPGTTDIKHADNEEVWGTYRAAENQGSIRIYDSMIRGQNGSLGEEARDSQIYLIEHEIGHGVELSEFYDEETYGKFMWHAGCSDSDYSELEAIAPELSEIIRIIRNPGECPELFNRQAQKYLNHLATMPESAEKGELRQFTARELMADQIAAGLHIAQSQTGENNTLLYLESRMRFISRGKLNTFLSRITGNNIEGFCEQRGIEINEEMKPAEIILKISEEPEFATLLKTNRLWAEVLNSKLTRSNELHLRPQAAGQIYESEEALSLDQFGGWYEDGGSFSRGSGGEEAGGGTTNAGEQAVETIVNFLTGTKS